MYFPRNWEFGSDLSKLRNFWGGVEPSNPPLLGTPLIACLRWRISLPPRNKLGLGTSKDKTEKNNGEGDGGKC
jgi:hypothetical protein